MNAKPLVTIGIPTYNRAGGFLRQALQSAVDQTYDDIEIIVSDNCSSDHTEALVKEFSHPGLRYVKHPENIGANNNFNYCVNNARGKYFLLLPDDDLLDPDCIETCMNAVNSDADVGVIFAGSRVIDENGITQGETPNRGAGSSTTDFFLGWFAGQTALYLCSTLFNTRYLQELGGFKSKTNLFQDVVAEVILAYKYGRVDVYDVKAGFRRHSANSGGKVSTIRAWCDDCVYLLDIMCDLAKEQKPLVKVKGLQYFAKKNYKLASTIESPIDRYRTYFMISKTFGHSFTPLHFIYYRDLRPIPTRIKRMFFGPSRRLG